MRCEMSNFTLLGVLKQGLQRWDTVEMQSMGIAICAEAEDITSSCYSITNLLEPINCNRICNRHARLHPCSTPAATTPEPRIHILPP